ncbi:MAG: ribulokinase [Synergistaceae bacterium]|jgi:L-ribulokinase|nr:ribulokinase [Synergistaceae bacterium]
MVRKYTIGIDFGTLSGRAIIVDAKTGEEFADSEYVYPHAVLDERLPDGTPLGVDWALQHPKDWLEVYYETLPAVFQRSGISPDDVIGVGVDFTACTFMPVKRDGTPLCFVPGFESNPNAWPKLWKHHAAQDKANMLNDSAHSRKEDWINRYGGKISSEWEVPKAWEVLSQSPEAYAAADYFMEGADWIVWQLCGKPTRNTCTAGYKGIWHKRDGYPSPDFFASLDSRMRNYIAEKLDYTIVQLGARAGGVTKEMAARTGLKEGTAVAAGNMDAHVTVPAVGIDGPGKMLAIMGTSSCHIFLGTEEKEVPGTCGVVEDGVYPGYYGYEGGQSCVGDHFAWFAENCIPAGYIEKAKAEGLKPLAYMDKKAAELKPGQSGLVALDWWNGNRSVLVDVDLTGMMVGMSLATKPEEMYRALIEATAYGTRRLIEQFRKYGVPVDEFYASGGLSQKSSIMMQIYADVIRMPVKIAGSKHGPALGSAIFASVAAGSKNGGYDDILTAARAMGKLKDVVYEPIAENADMYDKLYAEYVILHDYFGRGANDVMKRLKSIKKLFK